MNPEKQAKQVPEKIQFDWEEIEGPDWALKTHSYMPCAPSIVVLNDVAVPVGEKATRLGKSLASMPLSKIGEDEGINEIYFRTSDDKIFRILADLTGEYSLFDGQVLRSLDLSQTIAVEQTLKFGKEGGLKTEPITEIIGITSSTPTEDVRYHSTMVMTFELKTETY